MSLKKRRQRQLRKLQMPGLKEALLQNAPRQVKVTLGDVDVFLKVPSSWKCADVNSAVG